MRDPPHWWAWDFVLIDHVRDRMTDRGFNEIELLTMIEQATAWHPNHVPGRFALAASHEGIMWEIIVEPDEDGEIVEVITAYVPDTP